VGSLLSLTYIRISRSRDRMVICTFGLMLPRYRVIYPLSLIMGVQLSKHDREGREPSYGLVVRLSKGDRVRFSCWSRDVAAQTLQALNDLLPVETRSSGRAASHKGISDPRASSFFPLPQ